VIQQHKIVGNDCLRCMKLNTFKHTKITSFNHFAKTQMHMSYGYSHIPVLTTLIKSYLTERCQRVLIDNGYTHNSTSRGWEKVRHGFSHGSILGP
jgi:hypothetical protein